MHDTYSTVCLLIGLCVLCFWLGLIAQDALLKLRDWMQDTDIDR